MGVRQPFFVAFDSDGAMVIVPRPTAQQAALGRPAPERDKLYGRSERQPGQGLSAIPWE
jgi:hypothetical protein